MATRKIKKKIKKTKLDFMRQLDILDPRKLNFPVTLIGAGGIGSPTGLVLTKLGVRDLTIWDPDTIKAHNLPNQLFPITSENRPKAEVLAELLEGFAGIRPRIVKRAFTGEERLTGVVISGVDNMESRKAIWQTVRFKPTVLLYIDGRMAGEFGVVYSIRPCDIEDVRFYEKTLHSDDEGFQVPCTARSIIYNGFFIAALIANQVKKFAVGEPWSREILFDLKCLQLITEGRMLSGAYP